MDSEHNDLFGEQRPRIIGVVLFGLVGGGELHIDK